LAYKEHKRDLENVPLLNGVEGGRGDGGGEEGGGGKVHDPTTMYIVVEKFPNKIKDIKCDA